jgi:hypothetical protein
MSYWTKRRKIVVGVKEHNVLHIMQNIVNNDENNELTGMAPHDMECDQGSENREVDIEDSSDVDGGHHHENDVLVSESEQEFTENDNVYCDDPNSSPSSSDSENDDELGKNGLWPLLARWAVTNGITHNALGELLDVLVHFHPELPKDPRTLLSTTKVDGIRPIAGGLYYHFGIAVAIKSALALDPKLKNCDTIHLQLNVDGLPLFKSSNVQFWPILGRLAQSSNGEPFAIGLFSGRSKPCDPEEVMQDFVEEMANLQTNGLNFNCST